MLFGSGSKSRTNPFLGREALAYYYITGFHVVGCYFEFLWLMR